MKYDLVKKPDLIHLNKGESEWKMPKEKSLLSPEADPEGMKSRMEAMRNWMKDPGEGFGKAAPELTWVKDRRPPPPPDNE